MGESLLSELRHNGSVVLKRHENSKSLALRQGGLSTRPANLKVGFSWSEA